MVNIDKLIHKASIYLKTRRILSIISVIFLLIGFISFFIGLGGGRNYIVFGIINIAIFFIILIAISIISIFHRKVNRLINKVNPLLIEEYEEIVSKMNYESLNLEYLKSEESVSKEKLITIRLILGICALFLFLMSISCFFIIFMNMFETQTESVFSLFDELLPFNTTEQAILISSMQSFFHSNSVTFFIFLNEVFVILVLTFGVVFFGLGITSLYYALSDKVFNLTIQIRSLTFKKKKPVIVSFFTIIVIIFISLTIFFFFFTGIQFVNPLTSIKPSSSFILITIYLIFLYMLVPLLTFITFKLYKEVRK